jgi:hypothetical protein
MPADDATEQDAPSTTDERQDEAEVEGQSFRGGLMQDPDFDSKAVSAIDSDPPESFHGG